MEKQLPAEFWHLHLFVTNKVISMMDLLEILCIDTILSFQIKEFEISITRFIFFLLISKA